jgi:hypothetical protein
LSLSVRLKKNDSLIFGATESRSSSGFVNQREKRVMVDKQSLRQRWENYRPSKTLAFWSCAACIVATLIIGFGWGGWVTGGTAGQMAAKSATDARAQLAAAVCVDRFAKGPEATARLASLKGSETWKRDTFIDDGGWTTLAGMDKPVAGAAILCVQQLLEPVKTSG